MSDYSALVQLRHHCGGLVVQGMDVGGGLDCLGCGWKGMYGDIPEPVEVKPEWDWMAVIHKGDSHHRYWPRKTVVEGGRN